MNFGILELRMKL